MIFVTVGTHEQPFNRLVKAVDKLKGAGAIEEDVIIQYGYSTYPIRYCTALQFIPYWQMLVYIQTAKIVICHGGPSSFMLPLMYGKRPIVVPRQKQYSEHVNDHQKQFTCEVEKRYKSIVVIENVVDLYRVINDTRISLNSPIGYQQHNKEFVYSLKENISALLAKKV